MAVFITDPDVGGSPARDYPSVYDAFVGEAGDQLGDSFEIEMRSTAGSADTTAVSVSGISNYSAIEIRPYAGQEPNGVWDPTKPRIEVVSNWGYAISIDLPNTTLSRLQVKNSGDYTAQPKVIGATESCVIDKCISWLDIVGTAGNSSPNINLDALVANSSVTVSYCLINNGYNGLFSVWPAAGIGINSFNNTIVNCSSNGIRFNGVNSVSLTNNICNLNAADYELLSSGTQTTSNNISQDTTSPDSAFRNLTVAFVDAANDDYNLASTDTAAIDAGVVVSGVTTDIAGTSVPQGSAVDIGAFEFFVSTGATIIAQHVSQSQQSSSVNIGYVVGATVDSLSQMQAVNDVVLSQNNGVAAVNALQDQYLDSVSIIQNNIVNIDSVSQEQLIGYISIAQNYLLQASGANQAQVVSDALLVSSGVVSIDYVNQQQVVGAINIVQNYLLSISENIQQQIVGNAGLVIAGQVSAEGSYQQQIITDVWLSEQARIQIESAAQWQQISVIVATESLVLAAVGMSQYQASDTISLSFNNNVSPDWVSQGQNIDVLSISSGSALAVVGVSQFQLLDISELLQHNVLVVHDVLQLHKIQNAGVGSVVGWLDGQLVVIRAIDGALVILRALDGALTIN